MRRCFAWAALLWVSPRAPAPDRTPRPPPRNRFFWPARAKALTGHTSASIHYLEFFQIRKKWIYPDIGYVDFAHGNYREFFIGGGRTLYNKIATWDQELEYVQATGPAARSAPYLQPWSMLRLRFTPKLPSEIVYFPYFPLNDAARFHQVIERAKFEYAVKKRWKIGAGYAGTKPGWAMGRTSRFSPRPISTKAGAFEFWLQKIPAGGQIEIRYALVHASR